MKLYPAILAVLLYATTSVTAADQPAKLSLSIGGFLGPSYWVVLEEGKASVRYSYNPITNSIGEAAKTKTETIAIPPERWLAFKRHLDEANVWKWKSKYERKGIADGTVWHVSIQWDERTVESQGANAFPRGKQFAIFTSAVSELLGDERKFK